jgi:uncharacterized protein YjiS (DUF1127 family)
MTTYSGNCSDSIDTSVAGVLESLYQRLDHWFKVQTLKLEISKERKQLLEMSEAGLSDMGITRSQAEQEAQRIDLPVSRLKIMGKEAC